MSKIAFCKNYRENHFNLCVTLDIHTQNYFENGEAEHPGFEICWVMGQSVHARYFRGKIWDLHPGELMIINAQEKHVEMCTLSPSIDHLRTLIIEKDFIDSLFKILNLKTEELVFEEVILYPSSSLIKRLNEIFEWRSLNFIDPLIFECLLSSIIIDLIMTIKNSESQKIEQLDRIGYLEPQFLKAQRIMSERGIHHPLSIEDLAKEVGLSKYHFIRNFKRYTGFTPALFLNRLKVERVKRELQKNFEKSITAIAFEMNYSDLSTFNKSFKALVGESPSEFRKRAIYS